MCGLSSCGSWALEYRLKLWCSSLAASRHVESSETRGQTRVSCIGRQILYGEPPGKPQVTQLFWFCWQNSSKWLETLPHPTWECTSLSFSNVFLHKLLNAAVVPNVWSLDRPSTSDYLGACEKCKFANSPQASRNSSICLASPPGDSDVG